MTTAGRAPGALVVGIGCTDRGEDGVGPAVAARVAAAVADLAMADTRVVAHEDPTALLDLLTAPESPDRPVHTVIVVDAVRADADPGTVQVLDVRPGGPDAPTLAAHLNPGPAGTHGFGLAGAVELARALGRLPDRVWVVGIVAEQFENGAEISQPVLDAMPRATKCVLDLLVRATGDYSSRSASKRLCKSVAKPDPASA